jgi:hypothetical protein
MAVQTFTAYQSAPKNKANRIAKASQPAGESLFFSGGFSIASESRPIRRARKNGENERQKTIAATSRAVKMPHSGQSLRAVGEVIRLVG